MKITDKGQVILNISFYNILKQIYLLNIYYISVIYYNLMLVKTIEFKGADLQFKKERVLILNYNNILLD